MEQIKNIKNRITENKDNIKKVSNKSFYLIFQILLFLGCIFNLSFGISLLTKYSTFFIFSNILFYGFTFIICLFSLSLISFYFFCVFCYIKDFLNNKE